MDDSPSYAPPLADAPPGFDLAGFEQLARSEEGHFWFEPRNRLLVGLASGSFPEARRYLEIGCGTGLVLRAMADSRRWLRLAGTELHSAGLRYARDRLGDRAELVQMDARAIAAREAFDLVGAFDVLEHISEDEAVMKQVHAALAPGGGFIVAVPQHPALWGEADEIGHHVRRYRRGELESKLRAGGFDIVFSTSYTVVVLPLMVANRLRRSRGQARGELNVHPMLNAALRGVLHAEVAVTLKGLSWPIGGSRVVVARKPLA
ncbi:MAG: class I SAM-dependent methyltransferase [Xanthobacteraceae bacterium]